MEEVISTPPRGHATIYLPPSLRLSLEAALEQGAVFVFHSSHWTDRYVFPNGFGLDFCIDCGQAVNDLLAGCPHCGFGSLDPEPEPSSRVDQADLQ